MFSLSIFGRYNFNFSIFIQEDFLCCSKINSNCAHSCHCDATDHLLEKSASGSEVENIIRINTNAIFRGQLSLLRGVSVLCEEPWHTFVHDSNSDQDLPSELCYVHF